LPAPWPGGFWVPLSVPGQDPLKTDVARSRFHGQRFWLVISANFSSSEHLSISHFELPMERTDRFCPRAAMVRISITPFLHCLPPMRIFFSSCAGAPGDSSVIALPRPSPRARRSVPSVFSLAPVPPVPPSLRGPRFLSARPAKRQTVGF